MMELPSVLLPPIWAVPCPWLLLLDLLSEGVDHSPEDRQVGVFGDVA